MEVYNLCIRTYMHMCGGVHMYIYICTCVCVFALVVLGIALLANEVSVLAGLQQLTWYSTLL